MEIWLFPNRRFLALQLTLQLLLTGLCATGAWIAVTGVWHWTIPLILAVVASLCGGLAVRTLRQLFTPRIAWAGPTVQVSFSARQTFQIPLDVVECFLLGQGATGLELAEGAGAATSTVVVRLAERAAAWHRRDVSPRWGHWCDGYITLRGTWCEPIDVERVNQLNRRLAAAKRHVPAKVAGDA